MHNETFQSKKYRLISEIKTALMLYKKGMNDLRNLGQGLEDLRYEVNSLEFILVPILLISGSFERLIKCLLCLILMNERGEFEEKPYEYRGRIGHNLVYLLNRLISVITSRKHLSKFSQAKSDIKSLEEDKALKEIIKTLSDFGMGARYHNLDVVIHGKSKSPNPINAWDAIEMNMLIITRGLDETRKIPHHEIALETQKDIIKTIEKFFRILGELFKLAGIEDFAKGIS